MIPRFGTPEQFSALRQFLKDSGYTEAAICERMGVARLSAASKMHSASGAEDCLELLIQLFLLGEDVALADVRRHLPEDVLTLLADLALATVEDGVVSGTVSLYPTYALYIISDKDRGPELDESTDPKVFSAITPNTEEFLAMLPEDPCPAFLELCSGAGAAALIAASRYAVQAFAYDLSERSRVFAEFSRGLNGIGNATMRQGDLYGPAGRRTFDRIVAHPPYVPSLRTTQMFRDGGEDGEWLTRRIVEGLSTYLHPGGRFYGLAMVAGIRNDPFEDRIRRWLREEQSEFDVFVVTRKTLEPARFIFDNLSPRFAQLGDVQRWQTILEKRKIDAFHYVSLVIQRRRDERPVSTISRNAGSVYQPAAVDALLDWETGAGQSLAGVRPTVRFGVELRTRHLLDGGNWNPDECRYGVEEPFRSTYDGPMWIAEFLSRCDGTLNCREQFDGLRRDELIEESLSFEGFEQVVRTLIGRGFLEVPHAQTEPV